jgi:tRNA A-37 threonylcarbamoyl transferase component Bud32
MSLTPGSRLGPYEIVAPIGSEASGRYKASDTRANRLVILTVLPPELSGVVALKERLEKSAKAISSLNRPDICSPVDIGHEDPATDFVVTEHLEGEPLAQRLGRGPIEISEALTIAIAIAEALDRAHRQGVVHGGLNPSSVMLTASGPRLLDFGLATLGEGAAGASVSVSILSTRIAATALAAAPLYALPYMAPELLAGSAVDVRSDVFAFGAVLYEMLAGKPAFHEKTQALLLAAVQSVDPEPLSKAQPMTPPALDHLVSRCLTKDPRQRLQTTWDLTTQLKWIAEGGSQIGVPVPVAARRQKRDRAIWAAVAIAAVVVVALTPYVLTSLRPAPEPEMARFTVSGLPQAGAVPISISPDGRWIVGSEGGAGSRGVIGRSLASVTPQRFVANNNITQAFWSPDSRSIAFFEDGRLKRAEISGGPAQNICETSGNIGGGTWGRDGVILFASGGVIQRVLAAGGQPTPVTTLDEKARETEHAGPFFLPDGRHFLYLAVSAESAIYVGALDSTERTRLVAADSKPAYAAPGYILFNRGTAVFAQRFVPDKLSLDGEPIRIADGIPLLAQGPNSSSASTRTANYAVSQAGVLVFKTGAATAGTTGGTEQRSLMWVDRTGLRTGQVGPTGSYAGVDLAPDGKRVALHVHENSGGDIWSFDLSQGRMQRLTFDASQDNGSPVWSPDGTRVAFGSQRNNKWGLYVKLADGTGTEALVFESDAQKMPMSWSPDGKLLVYFESGNILAVPLEGDKKPIPLLQSQSVEAFPQVSPDSKWLAYQSSETGRAEIYVRPFPDGPGKWQVSTDGGIWPRWRGDGKELFFAQVPNVMAAEIRVTGPSLQAGVPQSLFTLGSDPGLAINHAIYNRYAVTADGQRFLIPQAGGGAEGGGGIAEAIATAADQGGGMGAAGITVVLNWTQLLAKK